MREMKLLRVARISDSETERLWRFALGGDRDAFQALLAATYDLMFEYGQKFSRDRELVKDAIQDVYLEVLEKRANLSPDIPPKAYLLASLRRRLHRLASRQRWLLSGDPVHTELQFDTEFSAEHYFIQAEDTRHVAGQMSALLNALPRRQKEVVYLRFFQDLSRDEIAYMMDIRPQSVSNLLQTAFKWLKEQWRPVISFLLPVFFS